MTDKAALKDKRGTAGSIFSGGLQGHGRDVIGHVLMHAMNERLQEREENAKMSIVGN